MSFTITYRRLALINVLHSYYLDKDGSSFYELTAAQQTAVVADLLVAGRYRVMDDIEITPVPATEALLGGHRIVCRATTQGLLIGIAVEAVDVAGVTRYRPLIPVNDSLHLQFNIRIKNPQLITRSNVRINPVFPSSYYFTNDDSTVGKLFPSLSVPVQDFADGRVYEMGETAIVNGTASRAISATSSAANGWTSFSDNRYINEYDRILLPAQFSYRLDQQGITSAQFELKQGAAVIRTILAAHATGLSEVQLNFSRSDDNTVVEKGVYTLEVSGNNGYARTYTVYLNDQLYKPGTFGVLDLVLRPADNTFRLLDDDGFLVDDSPVFELRFLSRTTYWKYYFQQKEPAGVDAAWNDLPVPPGMRRVIISKQPYSLMHAYREISYASINLPNPDGGQLSREDDKICSDILLTKLKL